MPPPHPEANRSLENAGYNAIAVCRRLLALVSEMQEMQSATTLEDVLTDPGQNVKMM